MQVISRGIVTGTITTSSKDLYAVRVVWGLAGRVRGRRNRVRLVDQELGAIELSETSLGPELGLRISVLV